MAGIKYTLISKYKTVLSLLSALHRSAPQDRLRILAVEVEKRWMNSGSTQV
jgi:hypothetical protein